MHRFLKIVAVTAICAGCTTRVVYAIARPHVCNWLPTKRGQACIQLLLDRLYASFNYQPQQEPKWKVMRSCFLDGAVFIPEPETGQAIEAYDIDGLIAKWKKAIRKRSTNNVGYSEWIERIRIVQTGNVAYVDIVFLGREPTDTRRRHAGLDSLKLVLAGGEWKVAAFTVQYESKL